MAQYGKGSLYKKNLGLVSTPTGNTPATGGTLNAMGLPYAGGEKFRPKKHAGRLTDDYGGLDYMISQYKKDDERKDIDSLSGLKFKLFYRPALLSRFSMTSSSGMRKLEFE